MPEYHPENVKRKDLLYPEEGYKIVGACREVYKQFGGSFKESVVDKALTIALEARGLRVDNQKRIDIYFLGNKVGTYIPDKIINDIILMELKSQQFIRDVGETKYSLRNTLRAEELRKV